jgi:outer membrane protein OmpA-like peptidoglycan-associated protein
MTESTRRTALTACLALGMADLFAMNIAVFPDLLRRRHAASAQPERLALRPPDRPAVKVDVEDAPPGAPSLAPAEAPPAAREPASQPMASSVVLYFPTNVHSLGREARAVVDRLVPELAAGERRVMDQPIVRKIWIDGHTDSRGSERYNGRLGQRRAEAVAARLQARGVPPEAMVVRSFGASRPAASGDDRRALRRNRRVEIQVRGEAPP